MPAEVEMTLKQLAQIALGTPELTKVNLTVLHALIDVLLKKFSCEEEKVTLGGFESRCLQQLLHESKICPLPFNVEGVTRYATRVEQLERLDASVDAISAQLAQHFEQIRECNRNELLEKQYALPLWETYTNNCEDMCTLCENEVACTLLGNCDFLKKLLRRMSAPIVERIFEFERKIEELGEELRKFLQRAEEQFEKIKLIEGCIVELERLRVRQREHELKFIGTMEEVQDMMDAKLDKLHMPPLKKYIQDCMNALEARIGKLEAQKTCGKAAGIVMDQRCLSCGAEHVCAPRGEHAVGQLPDLQPPRHGRCKEAVVDPFCGCDSDGPGGDTGIKLQERMQLLNVRSIEQQLLGKRRRSCRTTGPIELIGTDGNIYRGSP